MHRPFNNIIHEHSFLVNNKISINWLKNKRGIV